MRDIKLSKILSGKAENNNQYSLHPFEKSIDNVFDKKCSYTASI